ncbi:asparagine synthase-related protein [Denitrobaculum tricleocarpae]|uniref:asparagine synthase (glutamine-hydrolyzing) n=1 Tax=Denitrobaculum tricleocarpae TaxID=2591009 RepID=A0A545TUG1_9PROT|nr:asparagine synthase-related protein [Denitrobaculum tricleocarpae]TQV80801.1 hypothetical protein FKG95_11675 [Denitrobaculum tricleocarpae]
MISTIVTTRFVAFVPAQIYSGDTEILRKFTDLCGNQDLTVLRKAPYLIACEAPHHAARAEGTRDFLLCDTVIGKLKSPRDFQFCSDRIDWVSWHREAANKAQLYNLLLVSKTKLEIESDILGLKPFYVATLEEGTLVASKLIDLFRIREELIKPIDSFGLAQLILTGHPFRSRTIHTQVRRSETGERLSWTKDSREVSSSRPRRLKPSADVRSDAGLLEAVHEIDSAISDSVKRHTVDAARPLNIGLSGGFDSRILAAILHKQNEAIHGYTYGHWHHREVRTAKRISRELGIEHKILPYPLDNHFHQMELFFSEMEGQSDSTSVQIANLMRINAPAGTPLLHGFMSDAVAVTRFSDQKNGVTPKNRDQASFNLASSMIKSDAHARYVSELVGADIDVMSICNEIRNDMTSDGLAYHAAVLWDVENRQRRYIAGHLPMLGQKYDVIAPFYDEKLMSIWFSLPRISLDERYLQRQQLAKLYPNLAKIPHSEETAPITPSLSNQLRLLIDSVLRKSFIPTYQKIVGYRTSNIWSLSGGMATNEQRLKMQSLFLGNLDETEQVLGLNSFNNDSVASYFERGPSSGDYITPRIVFQTSAYAKWLATSLGNSTKT